MTKRRPLFMEVADKLTALILEEYSPGSKIPNETELSERYGVSRTTVREAVKSLCSKNILEIRRGDGTYVTKKTGVVADPLGLQFIDAVDRINDLAEFSLIMQPEAAALAARKSTPLDMKYLAEANQALKDGMALYEDGKISAMELRNLDRAFHGSVMKSCHNYLMDRLDTILKESVENNIEDIPHIVKSSLQYHDMILQAIADHDGEAARRAMRNHVLEQNQYLPKV